MAWGEMTQHRRRAALPAFLALALLQAGCSKSEPAQPCFVREVDWVGKGTWLKADTHVHTKFSDGACTVEEVVEKAKKHGCGVLAITDHADRSLKAATREYHEAIEAARRKHRDLILFAGLEWNIPPYNGQEHATVLIHPDLDEWSILSRFKERFDDSKRKDHRRELAEEGLRWLQAHAASGSSAPVVVYEHPSRKRKRSMDIVEDLVRWREENDLVIGFAGAPGHQGAKVIGSFTHQEKAIDRWDPAAARLGDAWDTLLGKGLDVWAAHAPSDFHNDNPQDLNDYWPGAFSETWLYVREKSHAGVLEALRAGTFFAAHGHIVRQVEMTVEAAGLPRPAGVGEVVEVLPGTSFTVGLRCVVPQVDWKGQPNRLDAVELIGITGESTRLLATLRPDREGSVRSEAIEVPTGGIVLRARGRRSMVPGPDLLFYTNPIRIQAASR
jgi:hypothetical protein